ncbi:MAG: hypothetical protein LWX02_02760 [Deltaproteobacteria bacterium]|jgi:hypothetical protein|nr:hypothetical protein [Deltaproteobacteria bacterium]MDL1987122.1 hypothetical protein [Deltaproteobacteria bacterium]
MDMFEKSYEERFQEEKNKPVECLGMTFENDEKHREYFLEKLCEKLKDPEFRKIEEFPKRSSRKTPNSPCGSIRRSSAPGRIETWLDTK